MRYETNALPAAAPHPGPDQTWHCTIIAEAVVPVDDLSELAGTTAALESHLSAIAVEGTTEVWTHHTTQPVPTPQQTYKLTDREADIIRLVAKGFTNQQIGDRLYLAEATIKSYVSRCQEKMRTTNRAGIAALYVGALARSRGVRGLLEEGFIPARDNVR
jgi:DNA-binding CsgD family transcriptional regulator